MSFENFNGGLYLYYNRDVNDNLVIEQRVDDPIVVQETNLVGLIPQVPYQKQRIILKDSTGLIMSEVFNEETIEVNNYKVSYTHGLIWFHESRARQTFKATYGGLGVFYVSSDRIFSGLNQQGKPIVIGDVTRVVEDYDNRIVPSYNSIEADYQTIQSDYDAKKIDYTTNIVNNYQTTVKLDYANNVKEAYKTDVSDPWTTTLKPELEQAIQNYQSSTNPNFITTSYWTKTITVDNTNTFIIDLSNFNPVGDQISKFIYQAKDQIGGIELIKGLHWSISGSTVTLLNGLVFDSGDQVFINVFRGIATTPMSGYDGASIMNETITLPKLSIDVQNKHNQLKVRNRYKYTCILEGATSFTLDSSFINGGSLLEVFQNNIHIFEDDEYTIVGSVITLFTPMNLGDKVYYYISN